MVANCGRSASEKLGSADSIFNTSVQTCDGISNRLLYSRDSSASAAASWNDSVAASNVSFLPVRWAMLPRWQSRVLRWPISMSAFGACGS